LLKPSWHNASSPTRAFPSCVALQSPAMSEVMWMNGTAATGMFGFNELAEYNILRWTRPQSCADAVNEIKEKGEKGELTAVWIKAPAKMSSKTQKFPSVDEALAAINAMDPAVIGAKAAWEQAVEQVKHLQAKQATMPEDLASAAKRVTDAEAKCEETQSALDKAKAAVEQAQKTLSEAQEAKKEAAQEHKGIQQQSETIQPDLEEARKREARLKAEYDKVA